jgi:thioredoxin 2
MIRACPDCGTRNFIPPRHLADTGKCGKCKTALPPSTEPMAVDEKEFQEIVAQARVPVLVDFWAAWCQPCKMAEPEVKQAAKVTAGKALVVKVDTEAHPALAARYQVRGIPNFAVFRGGQLVFQQAGLVGHDQMVKWLENASH